jgi:4-amino-4-deoxy-L-arabinose transferase-like glycosyltransferase
MLPWSIHTIYSLFLGLKKTERQKTGLFLIWFLVVFLLFTFAKTKIPGYILPLFPALAIITARGIFCLYEEKKSLFITSFLNLILLGIFSAGFYFTYTSTVPAEYKNILLVANRIFLIFVVLGIINLLLNFIRIKKYRLSISLMPLILVSVCFLVIGSNYLIPFYEELKPSKYVIESLKSKDLAYQTANYYSYKDWRLSSLLFYLESTKGIKSLTTKKELSDLLNEKSKSVIFINKPIYLEIKNSLPSHILIDQKYDLVVIETR